MTDSIESLKAELAAARALIAELEAMHVARATAASLRISFGEIEGLMSGMPRPETVVRKLSWTESQKYRDLPRDVELESHPGKRFAVRRIEYDQHANARVEFFELLPRPENQRLPIA